MEREIRFNSPDSSRRRKLEEDAALLLHEEIAIPEPATGGASELPAALPIPLNIGGSLPVLPPFPSRSLVNIQRKRKLNWHEAAAAMNPNFLESDRLLGLYDPSYEAIGIPLDPHLRIFNGGYENGEEILKLVLSLWWVFMKWALRLQEDEGGSRLKKSSEANKP
ncbi:hypothetical protein M569_17257 [Genlisea aurea]|uniref:Uncharacterized protein n=1 Tax=Genlisea aurea TaxID=192259 RepID=S8BSJ9_9LAMI|nr:hypothetical protein M569_17257 [Genlisea aurea]